MSNATGPYYYRINTVYHTDESFRIVLIVLLVAISPKVTSPDEGWFVCSDTWDVSPDEMEEVCAWNDALTGYIETRTLQFESIRRTIQDNWGLHLTLDERKDLLQEAVSGEVVLDIAPTYGSLEGFL